MIRCAFTLTISPSLWWYMVNEEVSWMASLCGDKNDKRIISKLNVYRHNSRKGRARTTAQSMTLGKGQSCATGAPHTACVPPRSSAPFSQPSFPLSHPFRPFFLYPFISAWHLKQKQFHQGQRVCVAGLAPSTAGWKAKIPSVCGYSAVKPHPIQQATLEHPRGSSSLGVYEYSASVW